MIVQLRIVLFALILLACQSARAGAIVTLFGLPGQTPNIPNYFAGTNCRVSGSAVISGGGTVGFTACKTTINGLVAAEWISSSGEPAMQHVSQEIMFDSTKFTSWQVVEVVFSARGDDNVWYHSDPVFVQVRNQAAVFGRYDLEVEPMVFEWTEPLVSGEYELGDSTWSGTPHASSILIDIGYRIYGGGSVKFPGWSWTDLRDALEVSTVVYVNTHGSELLGNVYFETDSNDLSFYYPAIPLDEDVDRQLVTGVFEDHPPTWFEVHPVRTAANGAGLPPLNTTYNPPVNLAWIDGCKSGYQNLPSTNNTFPEAFLYPGGNFYVPPGPFPENQAFCGALIDVDINKTSAVARVFFRSLLLGYTVNHSRERAYKAYDEGAGSNWRELSHAWMAVYGDWATKLKGVYRGDPESELADTIWSRIL